MTDLAQTFAALSDPTRLRFIDHLMTTGEAPAGALADLTDISAPAVSRHLKVLREAGIVRQRVQGTHRFYSVRPEAIREVAGWIHDHRAFWTASLDRLGTLLALDPDGEDT